MTAELTKARLRRGCTSLDALRNHINEGPDHNSQDDTTDVSAALHPRWIRVNTLRTSLEDLRHVGLSDYARKLDLHDIKAARKKHKVLYFDETVPDLIAIPSNIDVTGETLYKEGKIILQDKASCFPALLLDPGTIDGDVIDACAAPGNKTTHLVALISLAKSVNGGPRLDRKIFACEKDVLRSETLTRMVKIAGANHLVRVKAKQDFSRLDPTSREFANVTCLLLDPSCSGSGIIGRDEVTAEIHLPKANTNDDKLPIGKKRKRDDDVMQTKIKVTESTSADQEVEQALTDTNETKLKTRLTALSSFQLRLLQHAMSFPAAQRITYSTCSIHNEENEHVVVKALKSDIARTRGWSILKRRDQVEGLKNWKRRGKSDAVAEMLEHEASANTDLNVEEIADACIRCEKNSEEGTMGFFVAGFVRDPDVSQVTPSWSRHLGNVASTNGQHQEEISSTDSDDDEWNGFGDEDG